MSALIIGRARRSEVPFVVRGASRREDVGVRAASPTGEAIAGSRRSDFSPPHKKN
ncbi:MAG: hypothetical protein RMY28_000555 [Nostoc sp. ChiSLP01]